MGKTFSDRVVALRKDMIAYIEDYVMKANRSIIVPKGELTYMDWDSAYFQRVTGNLMQVVPETEIMMISMSPEKGLHFTDINDNEVMVSSLDTEELLYVVDYLDYLDEMDAPGNKEKE